MLFSAGFLYELGTKAGANGRLRSGLGGFLDRLMQNMILEAWVSMPSTSDKETYTLKLNYVIPF
jgi:hypothetical protein